MIILDQHAWLLGSLQFLQDRLGEFFMHRFILHPIFGPENRPGVGNMTKRPQTLIGKSVVITVFLFFGHPHSPQYILRFLRRNFKLIVLIYRFSVAGPATLSDPSAATCL